MDRLLHTLTAFILFYIPSIAQDSLASLEFSGSVDVYYKYDLSGIQNDEGTGNIPTSFAGNQNSISIGMANIILSQSWEQVSFVADIAFGPRGQGQSILNSANGNSFHIQNLNVSYNPVDWLTLTAGFMSTFIGYEVISPTGNFHYSTSYLFSNGPFQNSGLKALFDINEKVTLMAGFFNDWNVYQDNNGMTDFGAQFAWAPIDRSKLYFNILHGEQSGTMLDFVGSLSLTPRWMTGINISQLRGADEVSDFAGISLYQKWVLSEKFELGVRGEWFKFLNEKADPALIDGPRYFSITLSGNMQLGPLTLIPEWRIDFSGTKTYLNHDNIPVRTANQILLAAVYSF